MTPGPQIRWPPHTAHMFRSIQEQEEAQYFPQSEAANCLEEARGECSRRSNLAPEYGSGPVLVETLAPYFCRSTDAFAGMQVASRHRFPHHDAAAAWLASQWSKEEDCDPDLEFKVSPPLPCYDVPEAPAELDSFGEDDIPF